MAATLGNSKQSFDATAAAPPTAAAPMPASEMPCLNCGSQLTGPFCSNCGQRAAPPHPTFKELGHDALSEFAGWDGKLMHTLRLLMTRPGQLTVDFLAGKRARYISPVRLYLSASVVYFLLATSAPGGLKMSINPGAKPGAYVSAPVVGNSNAIEEADRRELLARIDNLPAIYRPVVLKFVANPLGFQKDIFDALPKVLFALLPVFAGIVALFYRRRHFAAHLYFAIHLHAFAFVAMSLAALAASIPSSTTRVVAGLMVLLWIPLYVHRSFVRVYGGSRTSTLLKELGIGTLYGLATVPALLILAVLVASRGT
jgi:hypothetical protein